MASISHMRFFSVTARLVPDGGSMPMILREDGVGIKEGDEIGYKKWFVQLSDDDVWYVLTAGVVIKIDDLVITFKHYKYKKEVIEKKKVMSGTLITIGKKTNSVMKSHSTWRRSILLIGDYFIG